MSLPFFFSLLFTCAPLSVALHLSCVCAPFLQAEEEVFSGAHFVLCEPAQQKTSALSGNL